MNNSKTYPMSLTVIKGLIIDLVIGISAIVTAIILIYSGVFYGSVFAALVIIPGIFGGGTFLVFVLINFLGIGIVILKKRKEYIELSNERIVFVYPKLDLRMDMAIECVIGVSVEELSIVGKIAENLVIKSGTKMLIVQYVNTQGKSGEIQFGPVDHCDEIAKAITMYMKKA